MKPFRLKLPAAALGGILAIVTCTSAGFAQSNSSPEVSSSSDFRSGWAGRNEAYAFINMFTAPTLTVPDLNIPLVGTHDAIMSFEDSDLWGFGMGYFINDRLQINGDLSYGHVHYEAQWGTDTLRGTADLWDFRIGVDYNLMKTAFTPFVSGGIGWAYFDSGIPDSLPQTVCWWDPWWGYVCDGYVDTHTASEFTWYGGVGLRWDVAETLFIKLSYTLMWMEVGASGTEEFPEYRLSVGWSW